MWASGMSKIPLITGPKKHDHGTMAETFHLHGVCQPSKPLSWWSQSTPHGGRLANSRLVLGSGVFPVCRPERTRGDLAELWEEWEELGEQAGA